MRKYMRWRFVAPGTFPIPEGSDPYEWVRLLRLTAYAKKLSVVPDFKAGTVLLRMRDPNRRGTREIVPGEFSYARSYDAEAHYKTAYNQGFKVRWTNRKSAPYVVTVSDP